MGGLAGCSAAQVCPSSPLSHHPTCTGTLGAAHGLPAHHPTTLPSHCPTTALSHDPTIPLPSPCIPPSSPGPAQTPHKPQDHPQYMSPQPLTLLWVRSNNWSLTSHLEPISAG